MSTSPNQRLLEKNTILKESLRALLRGGQFSAKAGICVGCGVVAEFQKATILLWETGESAEVTLPVCQQCASKGSGRTLPTTERTGVQ